MATTQNRYILGTTDYFTKWVEAWALSNNTMFSIARCLYEDIMCQYGCPIEVVNDQGGHFINKVIKHMMRFYIVIHKRSTLYYPQAYGQAYSTNHTLERFATLLVNENQDDWD